MVQSKVTGKELGAIETYPSVCLSIDKMTRKVMIKHIQLTEVPRSSYR